MLNNRPSNNSIYNLWEGDEKVENLTKYQKVGDTVKVNFNVSTNEWQGKYFTSLQAWRIEKAESVPAQESAPIESGVDEETLPF